MLLQKLMFEKKVLEFNNLPLDLFRIPQARCKVRRTKNQKKNYYRTMVPETRIAIPCAPFNVAKQNRCLRTKEKFISLSEQIVPESPSLEINNFYCQTRTRFIVPETPMLNFVTE